MLTAHTLIRDRYLVSRNLDGNTGSAFEALDLQTRATVILRAVPFALGDSIAESNRPTCDAFEQAAICLLSLRHPQLPAILDTIVEGDFGILVIEQITGRDLATRIRNGERFSADQVTIWADQLIDALDYLHTLEPPLAHGQIDLAHLVLHPSGKIMLVGGQLNWQQHDPEQDLVALASALYTLLTGQAPPSQTQRQRQISAGKSDPMQPARRLNPATPAALSYAIARVLSLRIVERLATADELRILLAQAPPPEELEPIPPSRRPSVLLAVVAGILVLIGLVFILLRPLFIGVAGPTTPPGATLTMLTSPTLAPTILTASPAPKPSSTTAVVTLPPITPSATISTTPIPIPQLIVNTIEPTVIYTGTLPTQIMLRGIHLDQMHSARLLGKERAPINLVIATQAPDQLILTITNLPEPVVGEVAYQIELDGRVVPQSITIRDYLTHMIVKGVNLSYNYTGRITSDSSGSLTQMRVHADRDSPRIGQLRNGNQVDILRDNVDNWYQVRMTDSNDPSHKGTIGWIERWLVDDQHVPPQVFIGRIYSTPTDGVAHCTAFASSIWGSVETGTGSGISGATLKVVSADGRNVFRTTTATDGTYTFAKLGCTTWIITLVSVPNKQPTFTANPVTVRNLNGSEHTAAEVRFKIELPR